MRAECHILFLALLSTVMLSACTGSGSLGGENDSEPGNGGGDDDEDDAAII